jgi:hypothetical protein
MQHTALDNSLHGVIREWCSWHAQEERQLMPALLHVADGFAKPAIGFGLSRRYLVVTPAFETLYDRRAIFLMVAEPVFIAHGALFRYRIMAVDLGEEINHVLNLARKALSNIDEISTSVRQAIAQDNFKLFRYDILALRAQVTRFEFYMGAENSLGSGVLARCGATTMTQVALSLIGLFCAISRRRAAMGRLIIPRLPSKEIPSTLSARSKNKILQPRKTKPSRLKLARQPQHRLENSTKQNAIFGTQRVL